MALDGEARRPSPDEVGILYKVRGDILIAPVGCDLSGPCIKCGSSETAYATSAKLSWSPMWVWLTGIGLCSLLVVYFLVRKTSRHALRLCGPCRQRWMLSYVWQLVLPIVASFASVTLVMGLSRFLGLSDAGSGMILMGLLAAAVILPQVLLSSSRRLVAQKIEDGHVHLLGVAPAYLQALGVPVEDESRSRE